MKAKAVALAALLFAVGTISPAPAPFQRHAAQPKPPARSVMIWASQTWQSTHFRADGSYDSGFGDSEKPYYVGCWATSGSLKYRNFRLHVWERGVHHDRAKFTHFAVRIESVEDGVWKGRVTHIDGLPASASYPVTVTPRY